MQNKDGSFNEWYPNEHSFVATAFSSYAISEAMLLLNIKDEWAIETLKKAGNWLLNKKENRVQNQQGGALIALFNIYLLTKEMKYFEESNKTLMNLIDLQTKEGWWIEYGPSHNFI